MILSRILKEEMFKSNILGIENEKNVESLGLLKYNNGKNVCTFMESEEYINDLNSDISMVITDNEIANCFTSNMIDVGVIITQNPRILFFNIHNYLSNSEEYRRSKMTNYIGKNVSISEFASIAPNNVYIGDNVIIEDFVSIKENTFIGDNSIIRSGSIIGGSGFEFKKEIRCGNNFPIEHVGGVKIGNSVEIQYNTCIDKALYPWDDTIIEDYTKVDNLVHVAHGVKIGVNSYIVAGAKIGGRCKIGDNVWVGIGSIIRNGINIGNNARVNMGAVVTKNIPDGEAVSGNFAVNHKQFIENIKRTSNLGE